MNVAKRVRADAPLDFEPFALRPLEKLRLRGKLEVIEAPGRILDREVTVVLEERELNVLLFAEAQQTPQDKVRVKLAGKQVRLEASTPREGGGYWNLTTDLEVVMGPQGLVDVTLHGGTLGDVGLSGFLLRTVEGRVEQALREAVTKDPRLGRLRSLWVEDGKMHFVYAPTPR